MHSRKINLWGRSEAVIKGSSVKRVSGKTDIISTRGGFREVPVLRVRHSSPTSCLPKEPQSSSPPFQDESSPATGVVWGIIGALFLWAVGLGLVLWARQSSGDAKKPDPVKLHDEVYEDYPVTLAINGPTWVVKIDPNGRITVNNLFAADEAATKFLESLLISKGAELDKFCAARAKK